MKETEISDERATGFSVLAGYGSGGTIDDTFVKQCLHSPPAMSTLSRLIMKIDEIISASKSPLATLQKHL